VGVFLSIGAIAQDEFLAKRYFEDGDYEKAVVFYEKSVKKNPRRAITLKVLSPVTSNWNDMPMQRCFCSKK
jgi:hypothetical protein